MERVIEPEWLDGLPANDRRAKGSRRDLKRLNRWMGHARIVARFLGSAAGRSRPVRLVELGAGDGHFLLQVAKRLGGPWRGTEATLVDRQNVVTEETKHGFCELGWRVNLRQEDVFDWCHNAEMNCDVVIANLFLHHFDSNQLRDLLAAVRERSAQFVAVEPRRSVLSLLFSNLVGLIGCNAITRHDAPVSVRAGFSADDLSLLWCGGNGDWEVSEQTAGAFSHLFVTRKISA